MTTFFVTTHIQVKNYNRNTVSAHNLGQIGGKRDRTTEACSMHAAGSDGKADSQDGLKCESLPFFKANQKEE